MERPMSEHANDDDVAHVEDVPEDAADAEAPEAVNDEAETVNDEAEAAEAADEEVGVKPATLDAPEGGKADDLKKIKGVGPKLETVLNEMGFYHFDQIASWTPEEVAWVDDNLEGFKGRVTRDDWVSQAKELASADKT